MMRPGRIFVNTEVRLEARFFDDSDADTDPTTVKLYLYDPNGTQTIYTYQTDDELGRYNTGDFYCDVTPDQSGRWFWRWEATGAGTTVAQEGNFMVDYSPHFESGRSRY